MKNLFRLLLQIFLLLGGWLAWAGSGPHPVGARAMGLAGAAVTLSDVWAISNNLAGITALRKPAVGVYAENRFNLKALSTVTFQGVLPLSGKSGLGAELERFGDKRYNEQKFGLGYAHRLGPVSLGIKATLLQLHLEQLGSRRAVALSFGGQSQILPKLTFGAHIFNFNQARIAGAGSEPYPTYMQAGLAYAPGTKILLLLQTDKDLNQPADIKGALEYKLLPPLAFRAGFSSARQTATGGVGFKSKKFTIDYALGSHSVLGVSNQLSVFYQFD